MAVDGKPSDWARCADASASALRAELSFSMAGPWVIVVRYDGEERDVPIFVSGQR